MGRIRVGSGFMRRPLMTALKESKQGDILLLDEGDYRLDSIWIGGITIIGVGDPDNTRITSQIDVHGNNRIERVTVTAPPFKNAVNISEADARIELRNCRIEGEPTGKYPAVYLKSGNLILNGVTAVSGAEGCTTFDVDSGGQLTSVGSDLGTVVADGGGVTVENSRAQFIRAANRSRVEATGQAAFNSGDNMRALVVEGESTCRIRQMVLFSGAGEIYCEDGYVELGDVSMHNGRQLKALTKGNGTVRTGSPAVEIVDLDKPAEPEPARGPKEVLWRQEDNRNFTGAVLPDLADGDTVVLEEGEYYLDDLDGVLLSSVDIRGQGTSENTVVNGAVVVLDDCAVALSNLTLRPRVNYNGLNVGEGTSATLTDVVVDPYEGTEVPAVYVAGALQMSGSAVGTDTTTGMSSICVAGGTLDVKESFVGRLGVEEHGTVKLGSASSETLQAVGGSEIIVSGGLRFVGTDCRWRRVMALSGAVVRADEAVTEDTYSELMSESGRIEIDRFTCPADGNIQVFTTDGGTAEVGGDAVVVGEEGMAEAGQPVQPEPAAPADFPAPEADVPDDSSAGSPDGAGTGATAGEDEPDGQDPLEAIQAMTGLDTVKEKVQDFIREVRINQVRRDAGLKTQQTTLHSMFLGNPGTGKTTVARLLGKALYNAGAVEKDLFVEVGREDLVSPMLGQTAPKTTGVLESALGGVLFIDEAYSLHQENNNGQGDEAVSTLLAFIENHRDEIMVIFAGYSDRMQEFLGMNPGLVSRVPNRFDFEDYSAEQIVEIGYRDLLDRDYEVSEALYRGAVTQKYASASDRSNGRWARNFNDVLVKTANRRIDTIAAPDIRDLTTIVDEDIHSLLGGSDVDKDAAVENSLAELDGLLGLEPVKEWVRQLVNRVRFDREFNRSGGVVEQPTYHMMFTGNPGTGKTTVARIVGRLFQELGILASPTLKEVNRGDLVGDWVGHSETRTNRAVDEALGGVLFVDEAYQLSKQGSQNDFGKDVINTLITRLENDRTRFVAIFAGYTDDMEEFLRVNPGLRSRIPEAIEFPDYTPEEVGEMVARRLEGTWLINRELVVDEAARRYAALDPEYKSNGRWARNFVDRIETAQKDYAMSNKVSGADLTRIPDPLVISLPE